MTEPIYHRDGDVLVPTDCARGPWYPGVQHGGAVSGLIARAIEQVPSAQPMELTRLTLELFRRVPFAPTSVAVRVTREGRRIQGLEAEVIVGGEVVTKATALRIRVEHGAVEPALMPEKRVEDTAPGNPEDFPEVETTGELLDFWASFDVRDGGKVGLDQATTWYRLPVALVEGETVTPLMRACITADFAMSAGGVLGFDRYLSPNPDLTVSLARYPVGEWIGLQSTVRIDERGIGQTQSTMNDQGGRIGTSLKSLLVERR